jgi:ABC-type Co2+ transport system permease subunit
MAFDLSEFIKRIVKYLIEGLVVGIAVYVIPKQKIDLESILLIGLSAAALFAITELFMPSVYVSAKSGLGGVLGANLAGGLRVIG